MAIEERIYGLEFSISNDYDKAYMQAFGRLEETYAQANPGQQVLLEYIAEVWSEIFDYWLYEWPWVDAIDLMESAYGVHEAVERALSDFVEEVTYIIEEEIYEAQAKSFIIEFLESLLRF